MDAMPSMFHERLIALFRNNPGLAPELLQQDLHIRLPEFAEVRCEEASFTQLVPTEYRADLVILLVAGRPVFGIILEIQLSRDDEKRFSWPLYAAALRAKLKCPTCVLVVAPDPAVAAWAGQQIETGQPASPFIPLVLGRQAVPRLTEVPQTRRSPELAVLSSLAHGDEPDGVAIVLATLATLVEISDEKAQFYYDLIWASLAEASRQALEAMMQSGTYQYQSEFARKYVAEGQAKGEAIGEARGEARGEAKALLKILSARSLSVTPEQESCILECQDLNMLGTWLQRAISASTVAEILV